MEFFKCAECDDEIAGADALSAHVAIEHVDWVPYLCIHCKKQKPSKQQLLRHMRSKHADLPVVVSKKVDEVKERLLDDIIKRSQPVLSVKPEVVDLSDGDDMEVKVELNVAAASVVPPPLPVAAMPQHEQTAAVVERPIEEVWTKARMPIKRKPMAMVDEARVRQQSIKCFGEKATEGIVSNSTAAQQQSSVADIDNSRADVEDSECEDSDAEFESLLDSHERAQRMSFKKRRTVDGEEGGEADARDEEPPNHDYCVYCRDGGDLLLCDHCCNSCHGYCLNPPLTAVPVGHWLCPRCTCPQPEHQPEKIVTWRWVELSMPESRTSADGNICLLPPKKLAPRLERELLVKWKYLPYWRVEWVNELVLDVWHKKLIRSYWRKTDGDTAPAVDGVSAEDLQTGQIGGKELEDDPRNVEEKFYRYGIKPEWLRVQRVIAHKRYHKSQFDYLIKWCDLPYGQATWERDDWDAPGYTQAIVDYWNHRERVSGEVPPRAVLEMYHFQQSPAGADGQPVAEVCGARRRAKGRDEKFFKAQPDYLSETRPTLRPYQLFGLKWLRRSWARRVDVILADESGLGKTAQTVAFLSSLVKQDRSKGPFLICAPAPSVAKWQRALEYWASGLYVVSYLGNKEARAVIRGHELSFDEAADAGGLEAAPLRGGVNVKFDVLVTSKRFAFVDRATLRSIEWGVVVVDEAHQPNTNNSQSRFVRLLSDLTAGNKVLLTGTPFEASLEGHLTLLNLIRPDKVEDVQSFAAEYAHLSEEQLTSKLRTLFGSRMLRRLKADVSGVPPSVAH